MKTVNKLLASTLLLAMLFTACQKDNTNDLTDQESTQLMMMSSEDNSTAQDLYQDVEDQVDMAIDSRNGGGGGANPLCPQVTVDPSWDVFPHTVTIDYGTDGCEGPNGRIRKGIIMVEQTKALFVEGAVRTATFIDFSVDDAQIFGTRSLANNGYDDNGNVTFTRTVSGAKIIFPNGDETTWQSDEVLTQIEGGNTPLILLDNVFEITGTASGVNRQGDAFVAEINEPLLKKKTCPWIVDGTVGLEVAGHSLSLDYGDGGCDKYGTLTLPNGTTEEVKLRRRWW